jgi:hypothetical protein
MIKYMEATDKDAFLDFPLKEKSSFLPSDYVPCPVCKGHGGWNLSLNSFPMHDKPNTAENRHTYSHFRCACSQCNGLGHTSKDNTCIHEMVHVANIRMCLNKYECNKCGHTRDVDSSD